MFEWSRHEKRGTVAKTIIAKSNWVRDLPGLKTDINITLFAILLSGTMVFFLVYALLFGKHTIFLRSFKKLLLHVCSDTLSTMNPFGLLLLSGMLRKRIAEVVVPKRNLTIARHEKWKRHFANGLIVPAVLYFLYLFVIILALIDIYTHCHPFNLSFDQIHRNSCQRRMECHNHGGKTSI